MPSSTRRDGTGKRYATLPPARQSFLRLLPKRLRGYARERKASNMDYYSIGWRDNADGQGQAYHDATDRENNTPMNTPTQAKHTPGRLTVTKQDAFGDWVLQFGPEASHAVIASTSPNSGDTKANADRLAHCWNNHDALLEALQALVGVVETYDNGQMLSRPIVAAKEQARAAIQAATQSGKGEV